MKCDVCRDNFTAYLEGDLTEAERGLKPGRVEWDAHLASCPDCTTALRQFEATVSLLRSLPAVELPAGLAERITAAVRAEKLPEMAPRRTRTWWELARGLAAAAALLIGVVFWTHWGLRPQPIPGLTPPPAAEREAEPAPTSQAPDAGANVPTGGKPASGRETSAGPATREAHPTRERHARVAGTAATHQPHQAPAAPAPTPNPAHSTADAGTRPAETTVPGGPPMAAAFDGGAATGATKAMRPGVGMLSVPSPAAPVAGGVQLQVLPPVECVVGEPAWISIGVTSDMQAADAQIRVEPGTGVELAGAPDGVVYRGALERGKTVRVPVEITVSRPGTARLRVVLHSGKPELTSPLNVTTPAFAPAPAGQTPRDAGKIEVRLAFDEVPLRDAFIQIGRETGVLVIPGEAVDRRPVTIDFGRGVPLPAALRILAEVGGYEVVHGRDTYRIEAKQHPSHSH
jgi:hypothetical protein